MKRINAILIALMLIPLSAIAQKNFNVPTTDDILTVEGCHQHHNDAMKCAKYYLKNNLDARQMKDAANYFMLWIGNSDEITITIGDPAHTALVNCNPLLGAYLAACVIYNQDKKEKNLTFDMHHFAMLKMIDFYEKNKDYTGNISDIDSYVDAKKEGTLKQLLQKEYDEMMKQIKESKGMKEL
jgi:hypothetical protein